MISYRTIAENRTVGPKQATCDGTKDVPDAQKASIVTEAFSVPDRARISFRRAAGQVRQAAPQLRAAVIAGNSARCVR